MKMGKARLKRILSRETGIPIGDITVYGHYECYGNKERLVIGSHTIVAANGRVSICEPVYADEEVRYRSRLIDLDATKENEHPGTAATVGRSGNQSTLL